MTEQQHLITPPQKLVKQWYYEIDDHSSAWEQLATKAAQWGWQQRNATVPQELQEARDEELDACREWLRDARNHGLSYDTGKILASKLRADRRPKPSLKEQALEALNSFEGFTGSLEEVDTIRRALESLSE